jgi:hypothetical protein
MIDSATGQALPCPICNSTHVRWRGRRVYDVPLTWARHFTEVLYSGTMSSGMARQRSAGQYRERLQGQILEANTGGRTATRFWRCPECRHKGEVYDLKPTRSRVENRTRPPG